MGAQRCVHSAQAVRVHGAGCAGAQAHTVRTRHGPLARAQVGAELRLRHLEEQCLDAKAQLQRGMHDLL